RFAQLRQRLPPDGIGCAVEEDFDLGVIPLGRIVSHPPARLEMEILQIVMRPLAACALSQDFRLRPAFAAFMDGWEVLEENPRPRRQGSKCPVRIDGGRVNARLNISEILPKERSHIRVYLIAFRDWQISTGATSRFPPLLASRDFGELAQSKTMPNKP